MSEFEDATDVEQTRHLEFAGGKKSLGTGQPILDMNTPRTCNAIRYSKQLGLTKSAKEHRSRG